MGKKLSGKVAIVTGASKGIGAAIAILLAKEGAAVVVNYSSSKESAEKVVSDIEKNGGKAIAIQANMAQKEDIQNLFSETKKKFGKLDILVNNAGIYEMIPLEKINPENYNKIFNINVLGVLLAIQEANKYMGPGGSIINISSVAATKAPMNMAIYNASKAAVDAFTRTLCKELGPKKIRINSVNPGLVETEGTQKMGVLIDDLRKETEEKTPLRRIGKPMDIAPAVVYLASDDSSWMTGETFYITGGER